MPRVLLIDDDKTLCDALTAALEDLGHQVTCASNGVEGILAYSCGTFDVVVTDIYMPFKEGLETIVELRQRNPTAKIIAMSGGSRFLTDDNLHIAKHFGAEYTLTKPFSIKVLNDTIQRILAT